VRNAIHEFNGRGLGALRAGSSRPREVHAAFNEDGAEALREMLHHSPREFGKQTSLWTLADAAQMTFEEDLTERRVSGPLSREPFRRRIRYTHLLVDRTGVGAGVVESFYEHGPFPTSVTIHGGSSLAEGPANLSFRVPKRDLVAAVQVLLQNGRLKIAPELELAPVLRKELLNFRVKIDPKTAHDSYEHWREGDHDDLVLATALACWYSEYLRKWEAIA
jgi:hypothetical protein